MWDTADQWLTASAEWHNQSFLTLEAEQIETDTNNYKNAIQKAFKFFDRNNLADQSSIAKEIKDQVKSFEPYVPIIVALRNQGMRPRHWRQVGSALGLEDFEPSDDFTLTKLLELDPASQEELITKVRTSVPTASTRLPSVSRCRGWFHVRFRVDSDRRRDSGSTRSESVR